MESKQQHLDDHYGDVGFVLVNDDDGEAAPGMSPSEARTFLQRLKPVTRVKTTLADLVKKAKTKS